MLAVHRTPTRLRCLLSRACADWSGAAMVIANLVSSELGATLILIFWPLFEPVFEVS